ncbi:MAG: PEGA domain-containing protein [Spirochaetaceae bacterium]|nr:PEGA domain-containing protein [Spirochaetaceae bacterium]
MRFCFVLPVLFFFFIQPIYCQRLIIKDEQPTWNVALTEFKVSNSREDISYISNILPSFFFSQFSEIGKHTFSSEEILLFRKKIISDQITKEEKNLSLYIKEYDNAYFREVERRREIKNKISDSRKKIKRLKDYKLGRVIVSPVKDIVFITTDEADRPLSFDVVDIDKFASDKNFDYVFYGHARQFKNIVTLEIKFYSALEKKNIYSTSVSSERDSLFSSLDNVISEITSILLGTIWSKITVNTDNRDSDIYLDEKYIGTGSALNIIVSPGEHTLTIKGAGQEEKTISVFLEEKKSNVFDFSVTLKEEKLTAINTLPQEANVYLDSVWMGVTPFLLDALSGEMIIRKDGFRDTRMLLNDIPQNSIEIQLSPDIFKKDEYIERKRNTFYTSISFFILSVPIPFFLYALTSEYNSAYSAAIISNSNYDEIFRLGRARNYTYYGYHASLFLTMALLVNTVFKLNDYIKAGDVLYKKNSRSFN